ncbi:MAG: ABC transporter substrate-binding protein [Pseudomonadota bacterium]
MAERAILMRIGLILNWELQNIMVFFNKLLVAGAVAVSLSAVASAQERIVSVGGDVTEVIYELGLGDKIVAVDTTSLYPLSALALPKVGYVRQLSAEGVLSVEPDMIIVSGAAGPIGAVEQLRASGVKMVEMETSYSIEATLEKTRMIAEALGVEQEGEVLVDKVEASWAEASAKIEALEFEPTVLFFTAVSDGAPRAAGVETAAQGVIDMIGGINVFGDYSGYKPLSLEAAVAADPDIILVMAHNAIELGGKDKVVNHPALSLTTAAQSGNVFLIDAARVMQFGPRTPEAAADLAVEIKENMVANGS